MSGGAMTEPRAEPLLKIPEAVERSRGGNHSAVSFTAAGQLPASPIPSRKRSAPNCSGVRASACSVAAVVQTPIERE